MRLKQSLLKLTCKLNSEANSRASALFECRDGFKNSFLRPKMITSSIKSAAALGLYAVAAIEIIAN